MISEPFSIIEVKSLGELMEKLNGELLNKDYIFRGHSCASWKLQSILERVLEGKYESAAKSFEEFALGYFRRRFHLYEKSTISKKNDLEWLSLMQHHGTPTRLLDFTYSPYVALYFAFEGMVKPSEEKFAIYAINRKEIIDRFFEYTKKQNIPTKIKRKDLQNEQDEAFTEISEKSYEILWVAKPNSLNSRMERQDGCFLLSGNISQTIEEMLKNDLYRGMKNYRIIAPCSLWKDIYNLFNKMNINSKTIYGDLEGLSKNIKLDMLAKLWSPS
jgi:hypothetical protein